MMSRIERLEGFLRRHWWLIAALLGVGIIARFAIMARGHNFDLDSWQLVADIAGNNGNVYAETYRYNYGPIWFEILRIFDWVAQLFPHPELAFRICIVGILTAADIGIWYILKRRFGLVAGFLFFLNPISVIITGYHNQFDTLAILCALAAVLVYGEAKGGFSRRKMWGLVILGAALSVKHVFFLFPLWLAVRETGWRQKLVTLALPIGIFLLTFVPFVAEGHVGIAHNVFGYASFNNAPFWFGAVPEFIQYLVNAKILFFGALIVFAFIMRKRPALESLLMYSIVLVVFSPSIANQYLAIVCAGIAAFPNVFFGLYTIFSTFMLSMSAAGLHSNAPKRLLPGSLETSLTAEATYRAYDIPLLMLTLGLLWHFQRARIKAGTKKVVRWVVGEIAHQLKSLKLRG